MTRNQIAWQQAMEEQRANKAREVETKRHNKETEELGWAQLDEQIRYNTQWLGETVRHNKVMEAETNRHNLATEANQRYAAQLQYSASMASVQASKERNYLDYSVRKGQLELEQDRFKFSKQSWQKEFGWGVYTDKRELNIKEIANEYSLKRVDKQGVWNIGSIVTKGVFDMIRDTTNNSANLGSKLLPFILGG